MSKVGQTLAGYLFLCSIAASLLRPDIFQYWTQAKELLVGSSPNRFPAPHSGNVTSHTPQKFGVRVALPGRRLLAEGGSADRHFC